MSNEPCTFEQHHADRVFESATIGLSKKDIAAKIGVPLGELYRLYRQQLKKGTAEGHEDVLKTVHQIAVAGNNASVLIFYLKAQCGWRDTGASSSAAASRHHYHSVVPETEPNLGLLPSH